jgi:uncharacterized repeat protein (TIGR01451 family)
MRHRSALFLGLTAVALSAPALADAAVTTRGDSGAVAADITPTRDAARADMGGAPTTINWDAVPAGASAPNVMPPNQFAARGVFFRTPGSALEVSTPDDVVGGQVEFGNVDPGYLAFFTPFSNDQIFRAVGSNIVDVDMHVPGNQTIAATTNGFMVAFTDVDLPSSTKLEAFDVRGRLIATSFAPPSPNAGMSLASIVSDTPIGRVRITSGTQALVSPIPAESSTVDLVAIDDLVFSPPTANSDLAVTVTDAPDPVDVNGNVTYTVTIANAGQGAAANVVLHSALPAGVAAVSATAGQGACSTITTCELGAIAAGASTSVNVVARPGAAGAITSTFSAETTNDANAANDTATASTTVNAAPAPDTTAPTVKITPGVVTVAPNGNAAIKIACPASETTCKGSVRLVTKVLKIGGRNLRLELGSKTFTAQGGKTATVTIRLGLAERALLKLAGQIRATAYVTVADAAGNGATAQKALTLKPAKKK